MHALCFGLCWAGLPIGSALPCINHCRRNHHTHPIASALALIFHAFPLLSSRPLVHMQLWPSPIFLYNHFADGIMNFSQMKSYSNGKYVDSHMFAVKIVDCQLSAHDFSTQPCRDVHIEKIGILLCLVI